MPFTGFQDLDPQFAAALQQMMAAQPGISVNSGYRTAERQAMLYNRAIAKYGSPQAARKWVAPPGHSRHNKRIAADLGFASQDAQRWAHANAEKYGLRFRMGHEPWHIEPISASTPVADSGAAPGVPAMMPAPPQSQQAGLSSYMQGVMGIAQGGGSNWMENRSYSADALLGDVLAGHSPLRRFMYQQIMGLFS